MFLYYFQSTFEFIRLIFKVRLDLFVFTFPFNLLFSKQDFNCVKMNFDMIHESLDSTSRKLKIVLSTDCIKVSRPSVCNNNR